MASDLAQKATGESYSGLLWMAAGAAALAVVAPLITRYLPISGAVAMILAGAALAYFASGGLRKAGQGAALYGVASLAITYLAPVLGGLVPGGSPAADPLFA